jgi:hypothetical protein
MDNTIKAADQQSIYNYKFNRATLTTNGEIIVDLEARFSSKSYSNINTEQGCIPFENYIYPPGGHMDCTRNYPGGRYVAIRIKDSNSDILVTQKLVCNPTNWPLAVIHKQNFIFSELPVQAGDMVKIEFDFYCSEFGHWYADPVILQLGASNNATPATSNNSSVNEPIEAPNEGTIIQPPSNSNSFSVQLFPTEISYTGDTTSILVHPVNLSAVLLVASSSSPLPGAEITFSIDSNTIGRAITNLNGFASIIADITNNIHVGSHTVTAAFTGNKTYMPSSDTSVLTVSKPSRGVIVSD